MDSSSFVSFFPFFFIMFLISSSATACDRCLHSSKVGYLGSGYAIPRGACGYGSLATGFSNGMVAAAAPSIYKNGAGCGSCFQISCKNATLCSKQGTKVIVTDLNIASKLDFVLTSNAFVAMANKGMDRDILKQGLVDVQYRRIPCGFQNKNLTVHVDESSHSPSYLAIEFIYQGGQTEITGVEAAQVGSANWSIFKRRGNDAVWVTSRVPSGALQIRMMVTSGHVEKWILTRSSVLPANWKPGFNYDSGVQITDVMQEECSPCDEELI